MQRNGKVFLDNGLLFLDNGQLGYRRIQFFLIEAIINFFDGVNASRSKEGNVIGGIIVLSYLAYLLCMYIDHTVSNRCPYKLC